MELSELSRNLTRLQFLQQVVDSGHVKNEELRLELVDTLKTYRNLIALCWEQGKITAAEESELTNLDRKLEALHEETRLSQSAFAK